MQIEKSESSRFRRIEKKRRAEYVGAGKKGIVEMLRDWFCAQEKCSPQNARLE